VKNILPSQLYIAEASESKERTKKELEQSDPDETQDFEKLVAEHEVKKKDAHSS
jgi:hypothetical protein